MFSHEGALYISLIDPMIEQKKITRKLGLNSLYDSMRIKNSKNIILGVNHFQKSR